MTAERPRDGLTRRQIDDSVCASAVAISGVSWQPRRPTISQRLRLLSAKVVTRSILQLDYARGVLVLAQRRD